MPELPWGVLGTIAALLIAVAGVWATRRYGNRHGVLTLDARNLTVVPIRLQKPDGGVELIEPNPPTQFTVELRLRNTGPCDITKDAFGGSSLIVNLGADIAGLQVSNVVAGYLETGHRRVELSPRQIPKNCSWHWFIRCVDQEPYVSVSSPITNVKVRLRIHRPGIDRGQSIMGGFTFKGSNGWIGRRVHRF